jgi:hypothetical protein
MHDFFVVCEYLLFRENFYELSDILYIVNKNASFN